MLSEKQQKNYEFFVAHLKEYLEDPIKRNKYAIFCEEDIKGAYDTFEAAYIAACAQFHQDEFIIQQIVDSSDVVEFMWAAVM